jgi:predicted AAA+ superfamily ATPase
MEGVMDKINLDSLVLYENIRQDEVINSAVRIFNEFLYRDYIAYMESDYYTVQRLLLKATETEDISGTYWQNYICRLLAESVNNLSMKHSNVVRGDIILKLAEKEICCLKQIYDLDWCTVAKSFKDEETSICCTKTSGKGTKREKLHEAMMSSDPAKTVSMLQDYYNGNSCGIYEEYDAFIWDGGLIGIEHYDHIRFDQLIGYERQKQALIENADFFMNGLRANNVLLYGDKGTGKSSCVKALLNKFRGQNLKMIELSKENISDLYKILEQISKVSCKFIIFIDDLSFEEGEIGYKHFKSVIEGGLESQPANVLIHVTSNRRNIIRETWDERTGNSRDVHATDSQQEKLSLADRFGLSITFVAPNKEEYLSIVKGLAIQEGLDLDEERIVSEALKWEMRYHSKSGRTARQFINYLTAKEGIILK